MMFLITEIDLETYKHTRRFVIPKLDYNQIISFESFFNCKKQRNKSKKYLYHKCWIEEELSLKFLAVKDGIYDEKKYIELEADIDWKIQNSIQCKDIYDFYTQIRYDRKTKKYINES